jgi:TRAP-type C4-dicarboxylate transport system permease small subunit
MALHAMGNFRGKKPLFKWACSHPWVEMQLQAWSTADDAPPYKVIMNGSLCLFWLSILVRVMIHLIRRYHQIEKTQRLQQKHFRSRVVL